MAIHKVTHKTFKMPNGNKIDIKYWSEGSKMCLAAFDENGKKVSACSYCFEAEVGDSFYTQMKETAMESLAETIENDLKTNSNIHYRP
jgi:hypothetical protein